jgi:hypothetical protein
MFWLMRRPTCRRHLISIQLIAISKGILIELIIDISLYKNILFMKKS